MILNNFITPLYQDKLLSNLLNVNLFIKRDDLYPISGGGSKGRKSEYILSHAKKLNSTAVVTCGGLQSNHTRATAIKCKEFGFKCTIVIHDNKPSKICGNYKLLQLLNVKIIFCEMNEVAEVMDTEMLAFESQGEKPFYIWGGGHCVQGSLAYMDVVDEIYSQIDCDYDYVFLASGTGTTQAGLHVGFKNKNSNTKVVGVSIARDKEKGTNEVFNSAIELCRHLHIDESSAKDILFDNSYTFDGYEKVNQELIQFVRLIAEKSGLILDTTYTGKAFFGLCEYIKNEQIPKGANVLFLHTGGLLNLMSSEYL